MQKRHTKNNASFVVSCEWLLLELSRWLSPLMASILFLDHCVSTFGGKIVEKCLKLADILLTAILNLMKFHDGNIKLFQNKNSKVEELKRKESKNIHNTFMHGTTVITYVYLRIQKGGKLVAIIVYCLFKWVSTSMLRKFSVFASSTKLTIQLWAEADWTRIHSVLTTAL